MILVFDVGGTNTRLALAQDGVLSEFIRLPTVSKTSGFDDFLMELKELVNGRTIQAIAGSFPLQLDGEDGNVVVATNLPEWKGQKILKSLKEMFDCPIFIDNDMAMCGLGEAHYGAGIKQGVMAYYTVSTGVNAARIIDGEVDRSIGRFELGYQIISDKNGEPEGLEDLIGGRAIPQRYGKLAEDITDESVWREVEQYLARAIYNTTLYWDPEVIVFGGSMMQDISLDRVAKLLASYPQVMKRQPRLVEAELGGDTGLHGAVAKLELLGFK